MRILAARSLLVVGLVLGLALGVVGLTAAPAHAQVSSPKPDEPAMPPPPPPSAEEMRPAKPSGFWGSGRPSQGGSYRYRLLGVGVTLVIFTGLGILVLIRRASRQNAAR